MDNLNSQEIIRAEEIIAAGLKKAADSLSFFMKETITLEESEFNISDRFDKSIGASNNEALFVLSTELKGQLSGVCYLVFTKDESDEICKVALPPEITSNPQKLENMKEPLLLEVDNILSASVITQLANQLRLKVHGDVPYLHVMTEEILKKNIIEKLLPDNLIMGFQTEFKSSKSHFHPAFFWILEPNFLQCVRNTTLETTD